MTENELASIVFKLGLKVHKELGPGLLESVYQECLSYELEKEKIEFQQHAKLPIQYDGHTLESALRLDLIIENKLIVEIKSVAKIEPIHLAQTITYLKMSRCKLGLLINFNTALFKSGVQRVING
jgi:GxxExxY protein